MDGWRSRHRQTPDGAVESEQEAGLWAPVVPFDEHGAERLGRAYWAEVEHSTRHVIRARERDGRTELRLLGGPVLLRFDRPRLESSSGLARCTYPILGGFLARRRAGEISFAQIDGEGLRLRSSIRGFFPRLAAREGEPDWTGALYDRVQSRIHVAISRRYFARLVAGAGR
ncbi:MAG: hypothetical protein ACJ747_12205 [Gaiellaceae bacterium]